MRKNDEDKKEGTAKETDTAARWTGQQSVGEGKQKEERGASARSKNASTPNPTRNPTPRGNQHRDGCPYHNHDTPTTSLHANYIFSTFSPHYPASLHPLLPLSDYNCLFPFHCFSLITDFWHLFEVHFVIPQASTRHITSISS